MLGVRSRRGVPEHSWRPALTLEFITSPSAARWYRAHNVSIVSGRRWSCHRSTSTSWAAGILRTSRSQRVRTASSCSSSTWCSCVCCLPTLSSPHPRLALNWPGQRLQCSAAGHDRHLLSLSRVLPSSYPLGDDLEAVVTRSTDRPPARHRLHPATFAPDLPMVVDGAGAPGLTGFLVDGVPTYAWDPADAAVWRPDPSTTCAARIPDPPGELALRRPGRRRAEARVAARCRPGRAVTAGRMSPQPTRAACTRLARSSHARS